MPRRTFCDAVDASSTLNRHEGLRAVKKSEGGGQITPKDPRNVIASVCIDDDFKRTHPNSARWDYLIGYERPRKPIAYFVEVHSAESNQVSKMEQKLKWLNDEFLKHPTHEKLAPLDREIHWIASGKIDIPKHTPQYKKLSSTLLKLGLKGPPVRHLKLV